MYRFKMVTAVALVAAATAAPWVALGAQQVRETQVTLLVTGLHCAPCAQVVQQALNRLKGVRMAEVDWSRKSARVWFDEQTLPLQSLTAAISNTPHMMGGSQRYAGWYLIKTPAVAEPAQAERVKKVLLGVTGVRQVAAYPAQRSVAVLLEDRGHSLTTSRLRAALEQEGFDVVDD
jgi:copper chaperone CopZ